MAGNIKGITIEFNGDTTKLGTALRDINKKTKDVDKALRDVNTALKFNPGNVELITQKQNLLKQKIEQTKEKLDALRLAQSKLDDDPAVDKTSQEYMELRREIIQTESKLTHFEDELRKLERIKFEQLGQKFKDIGGKMEAVGRGATKYVTTPLVGAAAGCAKAWKEVDEGLDTVIKKTGATGKEADGLKDIVKDLAGEIPADFNDIGSAVGEVSTRFGLQGDALKDLSGKYLMFAQLNDQDVSTAVDKTQKALKAFNLDADDAGPLLDTLNKVAQDTGVSVESLEDALVNNASTLQEMNMNIDQSAVFLGELETSGINADKALVGLKKAMVKGAEEGKAFPEVLQELQTKIQGASSDTEAMNIATEYFGKKVGPEMAEAIRNGTINLEDFADASIDAEGSVSETFKNILDPADKLKTMFNDLKILGYDIAEVGGKMLAPVFDKLSDKIKDLTEKWENLSPKQQETIIKMAGIAAAIGPLLVVGGKLMTGIGGLLTMMPTFLGGVDKLTGKTGILAAETGKSGGAFSKLFGIIKAHPILLIVGALAALTGAFLATGGDAEKFGDQIKELASKATDFIKGVAEKLPEYMPIIAEGAKAMFTAIADALPEILPPLLEALGTLLQAFLDNFPEFFDTILDGAITLFMAIVDALPGILDALITALGTLIDSFIENFPEMASKIFGAAVVLFLVLLDALIKVWSTVLEKAKELFGQLASFLGEKLSGLWDDIKKTAKEKWDKITDTVKGIVKDWIKSVERFFSDHLKALKQHWDDMLKAARDKWTAIKDKIIGIVKDLIQAVKEFFSGHLKDMKKHWDDMKDAAKEKWNNLKEAVKDKVKDLKESLSGLWSSIKEKAGEAWGKVKDAILKPIQTMKDKIKEIIDKIKGWFSDFHIPTPDIKMPHPYISPRGWTFSDLFDGITPSIELDWYAKGGIFSAPTIAGIGEKGSEAVVPLDKFWDKMDSMADSIVNGLIVGLKTMQVQGAGPEQVTIPIYLYPSGPKMGEETVKMYDTYKRRLG